jgi:HlyD family type I secretion membrane fusion protein
MAAKKKRIRSEALAFQPDAVAVSEGRPPFAARLALYVVFATLVFGAAWAWLSELDRVVSAPGMLVTSRPSIVVQPLETSVVRSIDVRPGDVVAKGQVLATLDPTFASADQGQLLARRRFLAAFVERLLAELDGKPLPEVTAAVTDPEERVRLTLFATRKQEYISKVEANDMEVATLGEMLAANANEQARLGSQFALAEEIEGMYRKLLAEKSTSRLEYLNALREKLRVEDLRAQTIEKQDQIRERLTQAKVQRQAFISGWHTQTATQLLEAQQQLAEVEQNLAKAARRSELVQLTAVADAVVKEVAQVSEGSVLRQAETLCTLTPLDTAAGALEAEVLIAARDIGHIRVGNAVRLKLAAFPFQRHGFLDGVVRMVSPDAFVQERAAGADGDVHYKARIRLTSTRLKDVDEHFRLLPGMTLTAEILVGKRRVASYLLEPILGAAHEAMSEP